MTTKTASTEFDSECDKQELPQRDGKFPPFMSGISTEGNWAIGTVKSVRTAMLPVWKNGKKTSKKAERTLFVVSIEKTNIKDIELESDYTLDAPGLLRWHLNKKLEESKGKAVNFGAKNTGRDEENRHQFDLR